MKEAAGEANMTVITIVLIGVVAAAGAILLPRVMDNVAMKNACSEMGGGQLKGKTCTYQKINPDTGKNESTNCTVSKDTKTNEWSCN